MQNSADLGGILSLRMLHLIFLIAQFQKMWNIGMKYVAYWYKFFTCCEELVPIFYGVKFAKCEICGSTQHTPLFTIDS